MKIAIIDDKRENLTNASEAVRKRGHVPILIHPSKEESLGVLLCLAEDADCVITDLMLNPLGRDWSNSDYYDENIPPAGLLAVIYALGKSKPVVVCTNAEEVGGHHSKAIGWVFDGSGTFFRYEGLPVGWEETKNWTKAVEIAEGLCLKRRKKRK